MASYTEIEKENNPKTTIIKYTQELHEKTGRNVIVYYSGWLTVDDGELSIESMDKNGFIDLINNIDESKGLDLILHTPRGSVSATESILIIYMQFLVMILEQLYLKWQCLQEQ